MTIKYRLGIVIVFCLLIAGCNMQTASNKQNSLNTEKQSKSTLSLKDVSASSKPTCSHTQKPVKPTCSNTQKPVKLTCSSAKKTTTGKASLKYASVPVGFLEVVSTQPDMPAELAFGQKLNIEVAYDLESLDKAMIWTRPYLNGRTAGSYRAHHLIPVDKKDGNPGIVECWFYFDEPAEVDEVRVFMQDMATEKTVKEISYKTNARWTEKQ